MKNYHQSPEMLEMSDEDYEELKDKRKLRNKHDRNEVKRYLQKCLKSEDFEAEDIELT